MVRARRGGRRRTREAPASLRARIGAEVLGSSQPMVAREFRALLFASLFASIGCAGQNQNPPPSEPAAPTTTVRVVPSREPEPVPVVDAGAPVASSEPAASSAPAVASAEPVAPPAVASSEPAASLAPAVASAEPVAPPAPASVPRFVPVCTLVGTRSEGWRWSNGGFIQWAKCAGATARCARQGTSDEGYYTERNLLIVLAPCAKRR
jgi:hypothetical protein